MSASSRLPLHLKKYVVEQNYQRYTPEDQAVWRFILRQLRAFLTTHAHESYLEGLRKTGIQVEEIPNIETIDAALEKFGWGAVPVSGFIPPAAFMEFQSLGILPIASDMRSLDHLLYTPAPDIVHEAAGHAPILIDSAFAQYLRKYAEVARNAIVSREDLDQYNAIRELSDIKEDPSSTPADIRAAEDRLESINAAMKNTSEAALLGRMNWWTAEYGLIGDLNNPRIYGAGLLSSVGESRECLSERVKKLPLDIHCIDFPYDITEPQPQLFVASDFKALHGVLEQLADKMSFRMGGAHGLDQALKAETVNTVVFDTGVQIAGILESYKLDSSGRPAFIKFRGECQLAFDHKELPGQGRTRHKNGFSTPVGKVKSANTESREHFRMEWESGIVLEGKIKSSHGNRKTRVMTLNPCKITLGSEILYDPSWGDMDLPIGETIKSVCGGPADRSTYGETDDFIAKRIPPKSPTAEQKNRYELYSRIRQSRKMRRQDEWSLITDAYLADTALPWLMGMELLELGYVFNKTGDPRFAAIGRRLDDARATNRQTIDDGLKIAGQLE